MNSTEMDVLRRRVDQPKAVITSLLPNFQLFKYTCALLQPGKASSQINFQAITVRDWVCKDYAD